MAFDKNRKSQPWLQVRITQEKSPRPTPQPRISRGGPQVSVSILKHSRKFHHAAKMNPQTSQGCQWWLHEGARTRLGNNRKDFGKQRLE